MNKKRIAYLVFKFVLLGNLLYAREFAGLKFEYMNGEKTNFYGFGVFTSDKRFDAEVEFFLATKFLTPKKKNEFGQVLIDYNSQYKLWFASFASYLHFFRTNKLSCYAGIGIMPFLPRSYVYHYALGTDFFWSQDWSFFYTYRYLDNNAGENYKFPFGSTYSAGMKVSF